MAPPEWQPSQLAAMPFLCAHADRPIPRRIAIPIRQAKPAAHRRAGTLRAESTPRIGVAAPGDKTCSLGPATPLPTLLSAGRHATDPAVPRRESRLRAEQNRTATRETRARRPSIRVLARTLAIDVWRVLAWHDVKREHSITRAKWPFAPPSHPEPLARRVGARGHGSPQKRRRAGRGNASERVESLAVGRAVELASPTVRRLFGEKRGSL
jgi:hypothetical protein